MLKKNFIHKNDEIYHSSQMNKVAKLKDLGSI